MAHKRAKQLQQRAGRRTQIASRDPAAAGAARSREQASVAAQRAEAEKALRIQAESKRLIEKSKKEREAHARSIQAGG